MDRNTELLQEIDATTKAILVKIKGPESKIDAVMSRLGYILTLFGLIGGLYAFYTFISGFTGGQ